MRGIHGSWVVRPGGTVGAETERAIGTGVGVFTDARVVAGADTVFGAGIGASGTGAQGEEQEKGEVVDVHWP